VAYGIKLGKSVEYTSKDGFTKAGLIVGTRKSVKPGTNVARPEKNQAHVLVLSATGKQYTRTSVPLAEEAGQPGTFVLA
jgi:hypothetical protein